MKNATKTPNTIEKVEALMKGTNLTPAAALAEVRKAEAKAAAKAKKPAAKKPAAKAKAKPAKATKRATATAKAKPAAKATNKKAQVIALMSRAQGCLARRDYEGHRLATPHGSGLHEHPGQQRWAED